jgi:hypothetical protein
MIIPRQKSFAEKQENKELGHAVPVAVGGALAASSAGATYLRKKVGDKRAQHYHDVRKAEIDHNFKQDQKELVKHRRARINGVNYNINHDLRRAEGEVKGTVGFLERMSKGSVNGHSNSSFNLSRNSSVNRNGKTISAGYDNTIKVSSLTKDGKTNVNVEGLDEAKKAINNSRKDFINVEKAVALNKNDELKRIRSNSHAANNSNLSKKLMKNKRIAKAGYVAAPVVGLAGYAAARKLQKNK